METDLYATAPASPDGDASYPGGSSVSAAAVRHLAATKPWVRFIAIMTFISSGFLLLAAVGMAVMGLVGVAGGMHMQPGSPRFPLAGGVGFVVAAFYVILAVVHIFPGIKLWQYGTAISRLLQSGRDEDLVDALDRQRSFWKFVGILLIAMICLYVLAIILFFVLSVASAVFAHHHSGPPVFYPPGVR